ncbi:MAG: hypothetical protein QM785_01480 [Pyrinomonadaceae bacterium]
MLLLIAVLATLSAAFLLFRYAKRRDPELPVQQTISIEPPLNARPLFEPTDEELRRESEEKAARAIARREYRAKAKAREAVDSALNDWRTDRTSKTAAELLRVATESRLEGAFSRAANEIIEDFRLSRFTGITESDLAALLDSHLRLLPAEERSSGELFWLKQEIADLAETRAASPRTHG